MNVAVVGGGVFGIMSAIRLSETGHRVTLFERLAALMQGASATGNRLHMGFHYPRDQATVRQCRLGYDRFKEEFPTAILKGAANSYFVASTGSLTSPDDFLAFCERAGLPCRRLDLAKLPVKMRNIDLGVETDEVVFDPAILRNLLTARLSTLNTVIRTKIEIVDLTRDGSGGFVVWTGDGSRLRFDAVVNCSYGNANRLTRRLGHPARTRQFEYTAVPIVRLDLPPQTSITIMDGPFFSLLPFGSEGDHLLFHVEHSVIAREDSTLLKREWLDPSISPFVGINRERWYARLLEASCEFLPALRHARLQGVRQGPRTVLANAEDTDARPSVVTLHEPGYVEVFSGKVCHCMWVGDEVAARLDRSAGRASAARAA